MGLFRRRDRPAEEPTGDTLETTGDLADDEGGEDDGRPLRPQTEKPGEAELHRIAAAVHELEATGVDLDSLDSLGAAYDAAVLADAETTDVLAERFGLGIGEYLVRHGGMTWQVLTDIYGSDLAVVARRGSKTAVPTNLVAARLMMSETGWLPRAVAHLARVSVG